VSPGLLSPIGVIFGLLVAFTAAQVWNDTERATTAVAAKLPIACDLVIITRPLIQLLNQGLISPRVWLGSYRSLGGN